MLISLLCSKHIAYVSKIVFFTLVRILLTFLFLPSLSRILTAVRCSATFASTMHIAC
jgi:positive regulator of sigma E activity